MNNKFDYEKSKSVCWQCRVRVFDNDKRRWACPKYPSLERLKDRKGGCKGFEQDDYFGRR